MNTGTIKFFNESKGYGFIKDESSNQEIFVHVTGLEEKVRENDKVSYNVTEGKKGVSAVNVKKV
ncbi:MAG TPA: cold shock domain-containing protein [Cytophagaceae bacterium]|jgi:CspA family cold shock protein